MPCRVPKRRFSCGAPQHLTKNQKKMTRRTTYGQGHLSTKELASSKFIVFWTHTLLFPSALTYIDFAAPIYHRRSKGKDPRSRINLHTTSQALRNHHQ